MTRDLNLYEYIKSNIGFESKSSIDRDYLSLSDKYNVSSADCNFISQLVMLGFEYEDTYIVPEYQRDLVWTLDQKENLIKSIFYGNPIGDFLFKKEFGKDQFGKRNDLEVIWTIIDGQQRINTLREFVNNKFTIDNKYFKDLKYWDVRRFLFDFQINVFSVTNISKEDEIQIYLNRNCGGTVHTQEEINKATRSVGK